MLLGKYHIIIFKEGKAGSRNVRMRGWLGMCAFIGVSAVIACNVWLWDKYRHGLAAASRLQGMERTIEEQNNQLLSMSGKMGEIIEDLNRVQQFDSKLRIMMNMDKELTEVGGRGGSKVEDFSKTYLPLHRQELAARKMQAFLRQLADDVRLEEVEQQALLRAVRLNREVLSATPSIWPVEGFISSPFGSRSAPFSGASEQHKGLDISNSAGTPIKASARGSITFAGTDGAYGHSVEINHGGGIITKYAHMQKFVVKENQWVQRGEIIGYVGSTGRSSGPHLHYEVRLNGVPVDPMRYILN